MSDQKKLQEAPQKLAQRTCNMKRNKKPQKTTRENDKSHQTPQKPTKQTFYQIESNNKTLKTKNKQYKRDKRKQQHKIKRHRAKPNHIHQTQYLKKKTSSHNQHLLLPFFCLSTAVLFTHRALHRFHHPLAERQALGALGGEGHRPQSRQAGPA